LLLGTIRVDAEKFEGAWLGRGRPGVQSEEVFVVAGGRGLETAIGAEVGEQGPEAVHRQAVVGSSGGLLADGGVGTLGLGDDAGAVFGGGFSWRAPECGRE
jgi:hypothetical protein